MMELESQYTEAACWNEGFPKHTRNKEEELRRDRRSVTKGNGRELIGVGRELRD